MDGEKSDKVDVAVIGAGIFGLSCAYACARDGMRVAVIERARVGAGASGGVMGALSPHLPGPWNAKKAFQLRALVRAEARWAEIARESGSDPGYARIGRWLPLADAGARARQEALADAAARNWPERFGWRVVERGALPAFLAREACPFGAVHETLSARIDPRLALSALTGALARRGVAVREACPALGLVEGGVRTAGGIVRAGRVIVAAGTGGAALVPGTTGRGVKGQAARLGAPPEPVGMVFAGGLYVIPHADGSVAVGSTSERDWTGARETDGRLDDLIAQARRVCPALADAPVLERWAAVRPRGPRPDPVVGPVPGRAEVIVANGGFKIGFGLAHEIAAAAAAAVRGRAMEVPESWAP